MNNSPTPTCTWYAPDPTDPTAPKGTAPTAPTVVATPVPQRIAPELLLARLTEVATGLRDSGCGLALIGLGSVGRERGRLDEYSDLDFFADV